VLTFFREWARRDDAGRGKEDAYVDVVAQELKRKGGSLATDIAICYVGLDA
jgi:hypothetical protein